ncbi:MAG: threonine synthase [Desulfobacterales bacterium]|nr:threonine synthase [Desulfobacterales bacterium]
MRLEHFPETIRSIIMPSHQGELYYQCLGCNAEYSIDQLLYTCPSCNQVLLIFDKKFDELSHRDGKLWQTIFDYRKMLTIPALKGIYLYHEFIGPMIPIESIVYLGEGHTPVIEANSLLKKQIGMTFYFKNDGQNPSASFKDRGMASAFSYLQYLIHKGLASDILAVCASTGDTSASAALYAAYLKEFVKSAVLLPYKKVTPQQLSQPLGSGAHVFEIPGVFDDCMKVVEYLSVHYPVALLNSKNAWRILGQESYAYEIAQDFEYDMTDIAVIVPIGNAGNITAILSGFLKFFKTGIIRTLPKIIGVQSTHANPVYRYYQESDPSKRQFKPVVVKPSVAQAAMIGNPVSMPRVVYLVDEYNRYADSERVFFVEATEQHIMDYQLLANQNGHIACTQGGESLAGLVMALEKHYVNKNDIAILDSTAHALKFSNFQDMYFENRFSEEFNICPNPKMINTPKLIQPQDLKNFPQPGAPLTGEEFNQFVKRTAEEIAKRLQVTRTHSSEPQSTNNG